MTGAACCASLRALWTIAMIVDEEFTRREGRHERPFFLRAVPNVTGASAPVRYADRAAMTKEIRTMTMPTVTYNGTAPISRITNRPVSVAIGSYEVRTAPPPPPKGKGLSTFGHYKRPDAEPARRGAYRTLEKAGMLPVIKP